MDIYCILRMINSAWICITMHGCMQKQVASQAMIYITMT